MSKFTEQMAEKTFKICVSLCAFGAVFLYGAMAQRYDLPPLKQMTQIKSTVTQVFQPNASGVAQHIQPTRGQGEGVTVNAQADDGSLILLAGFFEEENQARLIERDGTVVRKWSLDYFDHFPDPEARACTISNRLFIDTHGIQLNPNGDLVFNYEQCGTVKLDQCGAPQWTISENTHHSIVPSAKGGYWLLGQAAWMASDHPDRFAPFSTPGSRQPIREDTLMRIDEDGKVLERVSIPGLIRDSGWTALLTATGDWFNHHRVQRYELVHSNKVAELSEDMADAFPLFETGDLMISMRQTNLVIVIDPDTKAVKWHSTGPWLRQHDPEFRPDGRISVFNNNTFFTSYIDEQTDLNAERSTNIILMDPVTRETEVTFGEKPGQEMLSVIRGQHEILPDDGILITEFDAGRVMEVNAAREIVWEYVNGYSDTHVGEISNSRLYSSDYFTTNWDACPS